MIKSMTGFGKSTLHLLDKTIVVEIKTLNSKQFDLYTRIAPLFRDKENEIRTILAKSLERGKIDLTIYIEKNQTPGITIDEELAKSYFTLLTNLSKSLNNQVETDVFSQVLRLPDVIVSNKEEISEELYQNLYDVVADTCQKVNNFRLIEGEILAVDLVKRVKLIREKIDDIVPFETKRIENIRAKFFTSLSSLPSNCTYDANRLEQEIIYYIEKLDITEEKVRLEKHCSYFLDTLADEQSNGKKLGFIVQEIGREINTIGSKCNDYNIQKIVVEMKDEVEKLKEQLANIL